MIIKTSHYICHSFLIVCLFFPASRPPVRCRIFYFYDMTYRFLNNLNRLKTLSDHKEEAACRGKINKAIFGSSFLIVCLPKSSCTIKSAGFFLPMSYILHNSKFCYLCRKRFSYKKILRPAGASKNGLMRYYQY
jgi:hypothetical protein